MRRQPDGRPEPLTYYYFGGPISEGIEAVARRAGALGNVAAVGLGAGSLACHRQRRRDLDLLRDRSGGGADRARPALLPFLSACAPELRRRPRRRAPDAGGISPSSYDLIVLDAFSSDAIPIHLLTREALPAISRVFRRTACIVMHISNRHMELAKVVAAVGAAEGLDDAGEDRPQSQRFHEPISRRRAWSRCWRGARPISERSRARRAGTKSTPARSRAWTDDYSDIIGAILRKKLGR